MKLTDREKRELLRLAREAIESTVLTQKVTPNPAITVAEDVKIKSGAFVSVYVDKNLRGCIGTFSEEETVSDNVKRMAISSATSDNRFQSILPEELDRLSIEISVLSPRTRIYDISEITVGKHGIYMIHGSKRGTLLPQVALDQDWNVIEFLGHCSKHKAGLGWEGWRSAELYTYEAICFRSSPAEMC